MDIEELTKSQLILLTLLVSFVTSIATGIVAVTLMEEAPENVSGTITHVIERTVENVIPDTKPETQTATVIKEVPVVITQEDLVLKVVNRVTPVVGVLKTKDGEVEKFAGSAFLSDDGGVFITATKLIDKDKKYFIRLEGLDLDLELEIGQTIGDLTELKVVDQEKFKTLSLKPLVLSSELNIGQSVIVVGVNSQGDHKVEVGIIGSISELSETDSGASSKIFSTIATTDYVGAPLVSREGKLVGVVIGSGVAARKE
jgi:S1-C subfamily serine protease